MVGRNRESLEVLREMEKGRERETIAVTQATFSSVNRNEKKKREMFQRHCEEEMVTNIY